MVASTVSAPDVVVVGGGAVGLAVAWRSAVAGLRVTIVDDAPGRASSWAAAGMLAPVTEAHYGEEELLALNLESNALYPDFVAALEEAAGASVGYRRCGTLAVARDTDADAELEALYRFQLDLGLEVARLKPRECRELEPALAPGVRGGVFVAGDNSIDNRALVDALLIACERRGLDIVRGRAEKIVSSNGCAQGVIVGGDELSAGAVVLAAGCWSGSIGGIPEEAVPPVRPVKGQLIYLRGIQEQELIARNVRGLDMYVVPRGDGRIVVGATVEEQGFDTRVTAEAVHSLLRDAYELLPGILDLELTETVCGLRPGSPDNAPLLGMTALEGLIVATGHYRNGILLTPITGETIAELLTTGDVPDVIAPFSPLRFRRVQEAVT
jgi:glycine oxidase